MFCVLSGCERWVEQTDFFPLRDGNRWEYRLLDAALLKALSEGRTITTETAAIGEPPPPFSPPKAELVEDEKGPPPLRARRVALELQGATRELTFAARYGESDQVWSKRQGYVSFQDGRGRHYLLILPPRSGRRWIALAPSGEDLYYEVEGHTELATPAGFFQGCAVVRQESRDRSEVFRFWFAPDTGLVRRSKYYRGQEVFRQELVARRVQAALLDTRRAEERETTAAERLEVRGREHKGPATEAKW
jgi:hypothetical protein